LVQNLFTWIYFSLADIVLLAFFWWGEVLAWNIFKIIQFANFIFLNNLSPFFLLSLSLYPGRCWLLLSTIDTGLGHFFLSALLKPNILAEMFYSLHPPPPTYILSVPLT